MFDHKRTRPFFVTFQWGLSPAKKECNKTHYGTAKSHVQATQKFDHAMLFPHFSAQLPHCKTTVGCIPLGSVAIEIDHLFLELSD